MNIGEASLVTVATATSVVLLFAPDCGPTTAKMFVGCAKPYFTATRRLQERGSNRLAESFGDDLWNQIDDVFHRVTREVVEYAESVENPVLVLEDLTYIRENMDHGEYMNRRLHGWGFAKLHAQIRYKPAKEGIPVETVNLRTTSKACHACGEHGNRPRQATFRCSNDDCWLSEFQAHIQGDDDADLYSATKRPADAYVDTGNLRDDHEYPWFIRNGVCMRLETNRPLHSARNPVVGFLRVHVEEVVNELGKS